MTRLSKLVDLLKTHSIAGMELRLGQSALKVCSLFAARFANARDSDVILGFVPGRVEVAGKHTDYAGGHTLVCAIEHGFLFVAATNQDGMIRIVEDSPEFDSLEFPLAEGIEPPAGRWANYPMTTAQRVVSNFGNDQPLRGADIAFASSLPVGSGMSGSSALMMMCFCVIALVNRLHESKVFQDNIRDDVDLAMYLACTENGQSFRNLRGGKGVGTFGGSEDHTAILNCREGALSLYQYAPTVFKAEAAWPTDWALVIAFSGVRAEKTKEALEKYNLASRRASLAVRAYNRIGGKKLQTLADIEVETRGFSASSWLKKLKSVAPEEKTLDLPGRVKQFLIEERETTPKAFEALVWRNLEAFGDAISASHEASSRLLWNIAPEIDFLQEAALKLGAIGSSGFGAGFGGSAFAVTRAKNAATFATAWRQEYAGRYPQRKREAAFFLARPSSGIRVWDQRGWTRFVDAIFRG
jgi:galactokinase